MAIPNVPNKYYQVTKELNQQRQPGLFIASHAPTSILKHELFHLTQHKHGLKLSPANSNANGRATEIEARYLKRFSQGGMIAKLAKLELLFWGMMSSVQRLIGLKRPMSGSVGDAIRHNGQVEKPTYGFLVKHSARLGIPTEETQNNQMYLEMYQLLEKASYHWEKV